MRAMVVAVVALAAAGCTYVTINNAGDGGGPQDAGDERLGVSIDAGNDDGDADASSDIVDAQPDACWWDIGTKSWNCADACVGDGVLDVYCKGDAHMWDCPPGRVSVNNVDGYDADCTNLYGPTYTCCGISP